MVWPGLDTDIYIDSHGRRNGLEASAKPNQSLLADLSFCAKCGLEFTLEPAVLQAPSPRLGIDRSWLFVALHRRTDVDDEELLKPRQRAAVALLAVGVLRFSN